MQFQRNKQNQHPSKVKQLLFDTIFAFTTHSQTNHILLLVLDLLELCSIVFLYVNPFYSHLRERHGELFAALFDNVYPYMIHFRQGQFVGVPVVMIVCVINCLIIIWYRKSQKSLGLTLPCLGLSTIPIFLIRIGFQFSNIITTTIKMRLTVPTASSIASILFSYIVLVFNFFILPVLLHHYNKTIKILDILAGFLICIGINQYAMIAFLAVRLLIYRIWAVPVAAKYIKLGAELSLYVSLIVLIFIQPGFLNYIMLSIFIFLLFAFPAVSLLLSPTRSLSYISVERQQSPLLQINHYQKQDEDEQYNTQQQYSFTQLEYFKLVNNHINSCVEGKRSDKCQCRGVLAVSGLRDFRGWVRGFYKGLLKDHASRLSQDYLSTGQGNFDNNKYFNAQIQYIKTCTQSQILDFDGFLKLHELHPCSIMQEYKKYHYLKKYHKILAKLNPRQLKMSIINVKYNQEYNMFDEILLLQGMVCRIVEKVKLFWMGLLKYNLSSGIDPIGRSSKNVKNIDGNSHEFNLSASNAKRYGNFVKGTTEFMSILYSISQDISKISQIYAQICNRYEQKYEAQYYYSLFKLLVIHERPDSPLSLASGSSSSFNIQTHQNNYILITKGQRIINCTYNLTHLLERQRDLIVGNFYRMLMLSVYANEHSVWSRNFMQNYTVQEPDNTTDINNTFNNPDKDEQKERDKQKQLDKDKEDGISKALVIEGSIIKVVRMRHMLVPNYTANLHQTNNSQTNLNLNQQANGQMSSPENFNHDADQIDEGSLGAHNGVYVVSLIRHKYRNLQDDDYKEHTVFHLLVCRNTLDIVAYQSAIFQYFGTRNSIDNHNKLLRSNLKKLFPNLNRQSLLNPLTPQKKLIAKENFEFFEPLLNFEPLEVEPTTEPYVNFHQGQKKQPQTLYISQVPSQHHKQLNLLLFAFSLAVQKQDSNNQVAIGKGVNLANKKNSNELQLSLLKQKTLKTIFDSTKQQKNSKKQSNKNFNVMKIVLGLSFFVNFGLVGASIAIYEIWLNNFMRDCARLSTMMQLQIDVCYTKSYMMGLGIGQDRRAKLKQYWNQNIQYQNLLPIFKYYQQEQFESKNTFLQFKPQQSQVSPFIESLRANLQSTKFLLTIFFLLQMLFIITNVISSLVIFIQSERKSLQILGNFYKFSNKIIQINLLKIMELQQIFQICDYSGGRQLVEDNFIIANQLFSDRFSNKNSFSNCHIMNKMRENSITSISKIEGYQKQKGVDKKIKCKNRVMFHQEKKIDFQAILNTFLDNTPQFEKHQRQNQNSVSHLALKRSCRKHFHTKRAPTQIQPVIKGTQPAGAGTPAKSQSKLVKKNKKSGQRQQMKNGSVSPSLLSNLYKNMVYMSPSLLALAIKLFITLSLYFYCTSTMGYLNSYISYRYRIQNQIMVIMETVQQRSLSNSLKGINKTVFSQYLMANKAEQKKLPLQFQKYVKFAQQLQDSNGALCSYISAEYSQLSVKCWQNSKQFSLGLQTVLQSIQLQLFYQPVVPLTSPQLLLKLRVLLQIYTYRNKIYIQLGKPYLQHHNQLAIVFRYLTIGLFLGCVALGYWEFTYTRTRMISTHNLFKIVPQPMKEAVATRSTQSN